MEALHQYKEFLERNIDGRIEDALMVSGGRNSKVILITAGYDRKYVLKDYFSNSSDKRKRLLNESGAFKFLNLNGLKTIPNTIDIDTINNYGLYEYIDGISLSNTILRREDIDSAISFLQDLKRVSQYDGAKKFGRASEACFSFQELIDNLKLRINRLKQVPVCCKIDSKMHTFIDNAIIPFLEKLISFTRTGFKRRMLESAIRLNAKKRILSSSDFGFHNAVKKEDNRIVFLDFEYFGWDDPAKLLSDFLLHPNMNLSFNLKMYFKKSFEESIVDDREFEARFVTYFPYFGIKWCLIVLNEFIKSDLERRLYATKKDIDSNKMKERQYNLSKMLFCEVIKNYEQESIIN